MIMTLNGWVPESLCRWIFRWEGSSPSARRWIPWILRSGWKPHRMSTSASGAEASFQVCLPSSRCISSFPFVSFSTSIRSLRRLEMPSTLWGGREESGGAFSPSEVFQDLSLLLPRALSLCFPTWDRIHILYKEKELAVRQHPPLFPGPLLP